MSFTYLEQIIIHFSLSDWLYRYEQMQGEKRKCKNGKGEKLGGGGEIEARNGAMLIC